jgi:hypothetical protein
MGRMWVGRTKRDSRKIPPADGGGDHDVGVGSCRGVQYGRDAGAGGAFDV